MPFRIPKEMEPHRMVDGMYRSEPFDPFGAFTRQGPKGAKLLILASDGKDDTIDDLMRGWEHVSVSATHRIPNWEEMCWVKELFWEPEDVVVQYHPAKSQYVNYHSFVLHLWRHRNLPFPTPPAILVGPKL